ncbi:MAG: acetate--CoA ligase [Chitinophagales bacterium]|nr:acetate--CoA ligase [Chitinophagales bacterium]
MISRITSYDQYKTAYERSLYDADNFWAEVAAGYHWRKMWDRVHSGGFEKVDYKWFEGARLNITVNCLDRHLESFADKTAIIWEPNDPDEAGRRLSYRELHREVCKFSNVLKQLGVTKGDTVCIYMPMIPELAVAMLACARVGAIHSIVFGGFSAQSLSGRIQDAECKLLITADGFYRGDKTVHLKNMADEALQDCPSIKNVIIYRRSNAEISIMAGRDLFWDQLMASASDQHEAEIMDAEDPLFILYTSGSTGKPKGVVHTTAGYMVYVGYTFLNVFQYREHEVYWCTADIGWITGHSYVVYGPLLNGATTLMYEGIPAYPDWSRWWKIISKYSVDIFYTAPTAIRSFQALGEEHLQGADLSSLRLLGSVGEPINEEAWEWYHRQIGKEHCPIVDTWWQTETGGILITSLGGVTPAKPSFATLPFPGIEPVIVDTNGVLQNDLVAEGNLCIRRSWPGQARTVYKDHDRFIKTYFTTYRGMYFTGDGCRRDDDGFYRITGRVDDVIKVSGHRIGTAEVENAINEHPDVVESAVVPIPHEIKGEAIIAFVICRGENEASDQARAMQQLEHEVIQTVSKTVGPIAKPEKVYMVSGLPKTRSGKIMRRILRKIAEGHPDQTGDISTLLNPEIVDEIKRMVAASMPAK